MKTSLNGNITLAFFLVLLAGVAVSQEQPPASPKTNPVPIIKLKIHPKDEPSPALRYTLFPDTRELVHGNAAQAYYRAFSPDWISFMNNKEFTENQDKWLNGPLSELDENKIRFSSGMLDQIHEATRKSYCDWDMYAKLRKDGFNMLLPDLQAMRHISRALALDCRLQLKKGNIEKALEDAKAGLTLSFHLGNSPTLIQGLVAIASGSIMLPRLDEIIQQEKSPNLYWALTSLPRPLVDFRNCIGGEAIMMDHLFPGFREMLYSGKIKPLPNDELEKMQKLVADIVQLYGTTPPDSKKPLLKPLADTMFQAAMVANLIEAKKLLEEHGIKEESLKNVSPLQVVMMGEVLYYDKVCQDITKWNSIPYHIALAGIAKAEAGIKKPIPSIISPFPFKSLSALVAPAYKNVMNASPRFERRIAMLRTVEAIRLQAAKDKKWPETVDKITLVPLPQDPYTGKPFQWKKDADKITLTGPTPDGENPSQQNTLIYELELLN